MLDSPICMRHVNRFFAVLALALAVPCVSAYGQEYVTGVGVRVYAVDGDFNEVPVLAPSQTPNYDQISEALDYGGQAPWHDAFAGAKLVKIDTQVTCPEPGTYKVRLAGGGAMRLIASNHLRGDVTIAEPGAIETDVPFNGKSYVPIRIEQLTDGGDSSLRLLWNYPDQDQFVPIPPAYWRSPADQTRVTSPGIKRLTNTRRAGDGKPVEGVHPGYDLATIRPPQSRPSVGAMAFLNDGRLIVGTFSPLQRDEVSLPDIESKTPDQLHEVVHATGSDPGKYELVPVADGVYEPLGLCAVGDALYVSHRKAVTRLTDEDGDGFFETHQDVATGWEGWNYHQFTFGLEHRDGKLYAALSTAMAPPKWQGMGTNAAPNGPMRGCALEIDLEAGTTRVIAGGLRTPNTVGLGPGGDLFYCDNQGTWFPTSVLSNVIPGRFYGHFNNTRHVPNLDELLPGGGQASAYCDQLRSRPAVYLQQNEIVNSPSKPLLIHEGPFAGQMFIGEITSGGIRRVCLEKVNGQWQGAVFRFTQGLESGVNRLAWGPDGALYIGGIGANGNWSWEGTRFGLQRLTPNGKTTFEMHTVSATPDGFHIRFTREVAKGWLGNPTHYQAEQWTYQPTDAYGGDKIGHETLEVTHAVPDDDGRGVRITVQGLKTDHCVYLRLDPTSVEGEPIWSTEAYYTLNFIPHAEPIAESTLNGEPLIRADDPNIGLGLNVLPTADAVPIIGRSYRGQMFRTLVEPARLPNGGAVTQDELIAMTETEGVEADPATGDLQTPTVMGDHRLHVEWLSPGRADGGYTEQTGNSGVYIQGRYELQILATPADKPELENYEAGSIYRYKSPDVNASNGPGQWQAYDIWFRAARFIDGEKTQDARMTVYWNGRLIHNDVAVPEPTGQAKQLGEPVEDGQTICLGPLRLQGHHSDAQANVRFRNVWVAPIGSTDYTPGPWTHFFQDQTLDGWVPRGGKSTFEIEDGEVVGTAVPHSGGNTFLVSKQTYGDFELSYEIKLPANLNSGVQVRSHLHGGIDQRDARVFGYQVEADPSERRYSGGIYDEARRLWLAPLIEKPYARGAWKAGQWNQITVVAQGPTLRTWVNGVPAASIYDAMTPSGHLGLQVHDVGDRGDMPEVRLRNVKIRGLSAKDAE